MHNVFGGLLIFIFWSGKTGSIIMLIDAKENLSDQQEAWWNCGILPQPFYLPSLCLKRVSRSNFSALRIAISSLPFVFNIHRIFLCGILIIASRS